MFVLTDESHRESYWAQGLMAKRKVIFQKNFHGVRKPEVHPYVSAVCNLTHWTASHMTFLMANETTVVLVNRKSYHNEFFSFALLWNQPVKPILKADNRHWFHWVFTVLMPSLVMPVLLYRTVDHSAWGLGVKLCSSNQDCSSACQFNITHLNYPNLKERHID